MLIKKLKEKLLKILLKGSHCNLTINDNVFTCCVYNLDNKKIITYDYKFSSLEALVNSHKEHFL